MHVDVLLLQGDAAVQENIRKNEERMQLLNLSGLANQLDTTVAKAKPNKARGVGAALRKSAPAAPAGPRRATRASGLDTDLAQYAGGVASEARGGKITLAHAGSGLRAHASKHAEAAEPPRREALGALLARTAAATACMRMLCRLCAMPEAMLSTQ
jgi:hypothetical protein